MSELRDGSAGIPPQFRPTLRACSSGVIPPNVAVMRLLVEANSREEAENALGAAMAGVANSDGEAHARLQAALSLLRAHPEAFATVRQVMVEAEHDRQPGSEDETIAHWGAVFDRLARTQPEAGVALYALGSPALLEAVTAEVVEALRGWGLLGRRAEVLEIGCGIGRFVRALASEVAAVTGIDLSPAMIDEARRRCAGLRNVRLETSSGRDLAGFEDGSFDVVLAADVFPYLVQGGGGLAERHVMEAGRVLRSGGWLAILNYSYRGDPEQDRSEVESFRASAGFASLADPRPQLRFWDGSVFLLNKASS